MIYNFYSTSLIFLAGFCLFSALRHFTAEQSLQQRSVNLLFAGITLSLIGTILTNVISSNTSNVADHITWVRVNIGFNIVMYALLPWFFAVYSGVRPKPVLAGSAALCMLLFLINLTQPNTMLYSEIHGIGRLLLPWGEEVFFIKATPSIWGAISFGYVLFVPIFGLYALIRRYRFDRRHSTLIMIFAVAVLIAALTQNLLVRIAGIHNLPPLGAYGFLSMVIIMGISLSRELREDRKRAAEALFQSEARLKSILSSMNDIVFEIDQNGRFEGYHAPELKRLYVQPDYFLGKKYCEVLPEDVCILLRQSIDSIASGSPYQQFEYHLTMDTTIQWEHAVITPRYNTSNEIIGITVVCRDITALKRAEELLRESETFRRQVFESSRLPIVVIDANTYRYIDCNHAAIEIYGYASKEQVLGLTPHDFSAPIQYDETPSAEKAKFYIEKAKNEGSVVFEWLHQRPDGVVWDAEVHLLSFSAGDKPLLQFSLLDITERKQTEESLRKSEERFKTLFNSGNDAVFIHEFDKNGVPFNFTDVNNEACRRYGYSKEEFLNISPKEMHDTETFIKIGLPAITRLMNGENVTFESIHLTKTGKKIPVEINVMIIDLQGKQVFFSIARDITERKKAEATLRESHQLLEKTFASLRDAVFILDAKAVVIDCNIAAAKIFGYSREELLGRTTAFLHVGHEKLEIFRQHLVSALAEKGFLYLPAFEMKQKDGTVFPTEHTVMPLEDEQGGNIGWVSVVRDITDHKRLEEESNRLAALVRHSRELVNLSTPDGKMVFLNDAGKKMLGIPEEDIAQSNIMQVIPAHLQEKVRQELLPALFREGFWEGDLQYLNLETGRLTDVHAITFRITDPETGALQFLANVSLDITARKKVEEALHESEVRYRTLFEDATDGIALADANTGVLIDCNLGLCQMVERDKAELVGQMQSILHPPAAIIDGFSKTFQRHQNGDHILSLEDHLLSKSGKLIPVEVRASRIEINGRDCLLGIFRDITARKQAEQELRRSREQLIKADKMIALGTLVAGVAHEINNPNNFIMLNTPLIQEVWKGVLPVLEEYYRKHGDFKTGGMSYSNVREGVPILFNGILEGTRRISGIVKELKDFASPDDINMNQKVNINAAVKAAVNLLQNVISKATDIFSVTYGNSIPELTGNFQRLEQVVINLIHNACQALPDKTRGIALVTSCDGHSINVRIRDEGKGIAQEHLYQIMDPFFTTRQGSGGMGLGLSISQKIIFEHGGRIDVESAEGKGSTFTIILPLMPLEKGEL